MDLSQLSSVVEAANIYKKKFAHARLIANRKSTSVETDIASVCGYQAGVRDCLVELLPILKECANQVDRLPDHDGLHARLSSLIASIERGEL